MRRSLLVLAAVAGSVLALDLWTKHWASSTLAYHQPVEVIGQFVRLTYTRNSGVAFGLGAGTGFPYYLFSILAAVIILTLFLRRRAQRPARQIALSLILGGALGNLVDRLRTGEVVDFIEIGWDRWHWPVFNVADSAVTVGVVLFAITWNGRRAGRPHPAGLPEAAPPGQAEAPPTGPEPDGQDALPLGAGAERRRAAGPLSRGGPDRPLA